MILPIFPKFSFDKLFLCFFFSVPAENRFFGDILIEKNNFFCSCAINYLFYYIFFLDVGTRVWDCIAKLAGYIKDLQENMESLRYAMEELKNAHDDVKERVERDGQRLMK